MVRNVRTLSNRLDLAPRSGENTTNTTNTTANPEAEQATLTPPDSATNSGGGILNKEITNTEIIVFGVIILLIISNK